MSAWDFSSVATSLLERYSMSHLHSRTSRRWLPGCILKRIHLPYVAANYLRSVLIQHSFRSVLFKHKQTLYNYGARKVALIGVGQIGCSPNELVQSSANGVNCIDKINSAIQIFNNKLKSMVDEFNRMDGAHFTYINAYGMFQDILRNAAANGLKVTNTGCCGVGRNNGQITSLPYQTPRQNRAQYIFWDAFHPTEAANILIGRRFYSAQSASDAYPINVRRLTQI